MIAYLLYLRRYLIAAMFCHFDFLCEHLHPPSYLCGATCFMNVPASLVHLATYKFAWEDVTTTNMLCLTAIPPHISLLSKMDLLLLKQGNLVEQVVGGVKKELDERNMGGVFNIMRLINCMKEHTDWVCAWVERLKSIRVGRRGNW